MIASCLNCKKDWMDFESFFSDPDIELIEYYPDFETPEKGTFVFLHRFQECGKKILSKASVFTPLLGHRTGKLPSFEAGLEGCKGFCKDPNNLQKCDNDFCGGSVIRTLIQLTLKRKEITKISQEILTNPSRKLHLLIIEDDVKLRDMLVATFEIEGFEIFATGSGKEALHVFQHEAIQVVLADIFLDDGDGLTFLDQIRQIDPVYPPVILMTGFGELDANEYLQRGAQKVIFKPFLNDNLVESLLAVLKRN